MTGLESAAADCVKIAAGSGGAAAVLRFVLSAWFKRYEAAQEQKRKRVEAEETMKQETLHLSIELEKVQKLRSDEAINANRAMVAVLQKAVEHVMAECRNLSTSLAHTDEGLAKITSYLPSLDRLSELMPSLEKVGSVLEQIDKNRAAREKHPETEQVSLGESKLIRNKKPQDGAGG